MPEEQVINAWKEEYGEVYVTEIGDETFYWRTITRPEYKEIVNNDKLTVFEREEVICEKCVLFPEQYDFKHCRAGVPTLLAEEIMDFSGFALRKAPKKL
ncbi:hypothetical protein MTAT_20590 [Moorella thermoacetica]|uniref:Uncharacterized protein n=1 Tax=Neomoorella thermoacetica TaxID=1525 RepID=A0AAC9HIY8_NEOTH|nr:hypothetical protein [Moorella thermoacetica]AOQ24714.1 hypothetical protein Maut_02286 [Moorella thermoacetica]TYL12817.1 hypothetical protein MTAT_20590 [Moorella thermoacetica]